jgi:hypothetical protein
MNKGSKIIIILLIGLLGVLVLTSCAFKGKTFKYSSVKLSKDFKLQLNAASATIEALGGDPFTEDNWADLVKQSFDKVEFSNDGSEVTFTQIINENLSVTYSTIKIDKNLFLDKNKDGIIGDDELLISLKIKGSRLVIRMILSQDFPQVEGEFWAEFIFKRVNR